MELLGIILLTNGCEKVKLVRYIEAMRSRTAAAFIGDAVCHI